MQLIKKYLTFFLLIQIVVYKIVARFPEAIETYYSNGLFVKIAAAERWFFNLFSISIGDFMYGFMVLFILFWLWNTRKQWKINVKQQVYSIGAFLSVVYFVFSMAWGLNYYRVPMHQKLGIEKKYTPEELIILTYQLIDKANFLQQKITKTNHLPVKTNQTVEDIMRKAEKTFQNSSFLAPNNTKIPYKIKGSLYSLPLSYMGFGGYLNPFTNEAHININLPTYTLPTIALHELSHQYGIASESEANFIGYMLSVQSDDLVWQYSGACYALKYCLNALEKKKKGSGKAYLKIINKGVLANFKETENYNKKYDSSVEIIFKTFYDNYLKLNAQKDGLKEYSKFLGLIVNYEK